MKKRKHNNIEIREKTIASNVTDNHTHIVFIERGEEALVRENGIVKLEIPLVHPHKMKHRSFRIFIRGIVQSARKYKLSGITFALEYETFKELHTFGTTWFYQTVAENLSLALYDFTAYKSKDADKYELSIIVISNDGAKSINGFARGLVIGEGVNIARSLTNTPAQDMTPERLGNEVTRIFKDTKATVRILGETQIKKLNMGGLLGVGGGAKDKPRFIIIEYWGKGKSTRTSSNASPIKSPKVFVGKGVTFDSGGLQLKPGMAMYEMHMDMAGGASVVGSLYAIATLKIRENVIGLIPAAENAVGAGAMRPGDVLKMMSGRMVDVLHTDAEGRLILADALEYARRFAPALVIDIATLTGAALVALGQHASAIMTKKRALEDKLRELGERTGDYVFPLPLWNEYLQYTKGVNGDIANIPAGDSKSGGAINGGMFLSHFTKGMNWAHIDIAPRMVSVASDKLAKGATGEPVRLLVALAEEYGH